MDKNLDRMTDAAMESVGPSLDYLGRQDAAPPAPESCPEIYHFDRPALDDNCKHDMVKDGVGWYCRKCEGIPTGNGTVSTDADGGE